ncbi:hypothetical protein C8J57DRAFT_1239701 [Mycena rebaudengoi]|nr:hypothetical protein C8J57DRAFT_1239701 [Mycena rebaudengoi]
MTQPTRTFATWRTAPHLRVRAPLSALNAETHALEQRAVCKRRDSGCKPLICQERQLGIPARTSFAGQHTARLCGCAGTPIVRNSRPSRPRSPRVRFRGRGHVCGWSCTRAETQLGLAERARRAHCPASRIQSDRGALVGWLGQRCGRPGRKRRRESAEENLEAPSSRHTSGAAVVSVAEQVDAIHLVAYQREEVEPYQRIGVKTKRQGSQKKTLKQRRPICLRPNSPRAPPVVHTLRESDSIAVWVCGRKVWSPVACGAHEQEASKIRGEGWAWTRARCWKGGCGSGAGYGRTEKGRNGNRSIRLIRHGPGMSGLGERVSEPKLGSWTHQAFGLSRSTLNYAHLPLLRPKRNDSFHMKSQISGPSGGGGLVINTPWPELRSYAPARHSQHLMFCFRGVGLGSNFLCKLTTWTVVLKEMQRLVE